VYRCGDGQYSQTPCPGGRALEQGATPSAGQQAQARESAAAQARLAEQLRNERHARERAAAGQGPARIGPAKPAAPAASAAAAVRGQDGQSRPKKSRRPNDAKRHGAPVDDEPKSRKAYGPVKPP
jgi:hypothetical protein